MKRFPLGKPARLLLAVAVLGMPAGPADADGVSSGDAAGRASIADAAGRERSWPKIRQPPLSGHLPRRTDRSPDTVGSTFGLGKPAFTGLGSRPDWGQSND